ncbi:MAG: ABC transporter substrate-binding protein [Actinomycetota bacterium]
MPGRRFIAAASGAVALALVASGCFSTETRSRKVLLSGGPTSGPTTDATVSGQPGATPTAGSNMSRGPGGVGATSGKSGATDIGVTATTIKLGFVGDFTGVARSFFVPALDAMNAYIADLNSRGGINGRRLQLAYYAASVQSEDQTLAAVRRLVEQDKVFAFTELITMNLAANAAQAYLNEKGVPCSHCRSANQSDLALGPANFVMQIDPPTHGEILAAFAAKRLGKKSMALGWCESGFDKRIAELTGAAFERRGGKVVSRRSIGGCNQTSMESTVAAWYSNFPRPDVLMVIDPVGMAEGAAAAKRMGWDVQVMGRSGMWQLVLDIGGSQTEGLIATTEGAAPPGYQSAQMDRYRRVMKNYYPNRIEDQITSEAWASMVLLEEAIRRAGRDLTRRGVIDAINNMRDFDDGMGAKLTFSPGRHWGRSATGFYRIHDQAFEKATPEDFLTADDLK